MKKQLKKIINAIDKFVNNPKFFICLIVFDFLFVIVNIFKQVAVIGIFFLFLNSAWILFSRKKQALYIIFLLYPLARVLKIPGLSTSIFTILLFIFGVSSLLKLFVKHEGFSSTSIAVIALFAIYCLFTLATSLINKNEELHINELFSYYLYLSLPIIAFVFIKNEEETDGVNNLIFCFGSYLFGIITTVIFYKFIPNGQALLEQIGVKVFDMKAGGIRFSPLTDDPNYGTSLILLLSCLFILAVKTKKQAHIGYPLMVTSLLLSALSLSKMFILSLSIILLCSLAKIMSKSKSLLVNSVLILNTGLILLIFVGSDMGRQLLIRTIGSTDGIDLNRITTGRFNLFGEYSSYILSNPFVVLFGKGPLYSDLNYFSAGEHNTFTKNIFGSGLFGVSIMLLIFVLMAKNRLYKALKLPSNVFIIALIACLFLCCMSLGLAPSTIFPIFVLSAQFIKFKNDVKFTYTRIEI